MKGHRKPNEPDPGLRLGDGATEPQEPPARPGRVEIGVHIGRGQPRWKDRTEADGEVHRLGKTDQEEPLSVKTTTDIEPAPFHDPRKSKHQKQLKHWTWAMASGAVVLVISAVAWKVTSSSPEKAGTGGPPALVVLPEWEDPVASNPLLARSGHYFAEAERLLRAYAAATSPAEVMPLIRDPERVKPMLEKRWQPFGGISNTEPIHTMIAAQDEVPSLAMRGFTSDHSSFEVYFNLEKDGRLRLDWEATLAAGDLMLDRLPQGKGEVEDAILRVTIKPVEYYTTETPEDVYRSFQLLDSVRNEFAWGYVRRDSELAAKLSSEFQEDSVVLEKKPELGVTLRVSGPMADASKAFEITEMLHKGWVSP